MPLPAPLTPILCALALALCVAPPGAGASRPRAYHWSGDRKYLLAFEKQWSWVYDHQIDHATGAWYTDVDWSTGGNAAGHGDTYHDGRALMNVVHEIDAILAK
jgi:hypothetical protein